MGRPGQAGNVLVACCGVCCDIIRKEGCQLERNHDVGRWRKMKWRQEEWPPELTGHECRLSDG